MYRGLIWTSLMNNRVITNIVACLLVGMSHGVEASSALERVKSYKVLNVCIWPQYYGITYTNSRTGVLQGVDIDMSKAFAEDLGVKLNYVSSSFASFTQDLESDKCDIAMMGVGVTPTRSERLAFSRPYLRSDILFITTRSNQQLNSINDIDKPGVVIAVQKGTLMEPFLRDRLKSATLTVTTNPGEREREVESGRADAFATDYPYSQKMLADTDWSKVIVPERPWQQTDYAYAVKKKDPIWLHTVDAFLVKVKKDGRLETAARKNNLTPILIRD